MNKFFGLTISALAWLVLASAAEAITPDLRRAVDRYDQAQVSGDRKLLESLLAGDYVLVNSSGATPSACTICRRSSSSAGSWKRA